MFSWNVSKTVPWGGPGKGQGSCDSQNAERFLCPQFAQGFTTRPDGIYHNRTSVRIASKSVSSLEQAARGEQDEQLGTNVEAGRERARRDPY